MNKKVEELAREHCVARKGVEHQIADSERDKLMALLPGWELQAVAGGIVKDFKFKDYHRTMAFVNAVAWIAHAEDHHPDLEVGYNHCRVRYSTHDVGGLSRNDFVCAAKVELLFP
jgi:4a-hydroxytetrahydrobiopterin dehydratase